MKKRFNIHFGVLHIDLKIFDKDSMENISVYSGLLCITYNNHYHQIMQDVKGFEMEFESFHFFPSGPFLYDLSLPTIILFIRQHRLSQR